MNHLAAEIRGCERVEDGMAREFAARLLAVGATRPVTLTRDQLAAPLVVLERWEVEAETGRLLRLALIEELGIPRAKTRPTTKWAAWARQIGRWAQRKGAPRQ